MRGAPPPVKSRLQIRTPGRRAHTKTGLPPSGKVDRSLAPGQAVTPPIPSPAKDFIPEDGSRFRSPSAGAGLRFPAAIRLQAGHLHAVGRLLEPWYHPGAFLVPEGMRTAGVEGAA